MVEQNASASQNMAGEAERLRQMFSSKKSAYDESSSRISAGQLASGAAEELERVSTASTLGFNKEGTEQKVPQIEMPEWEKKLDNFK